MTYTPHEISPEEAAKRFAKDQGLFGPTSLNIKSLIIPETSENPLKKVLIPMFGTKAEVDSTSYHAEFGRDKIKTKFNSQGKVTKEIHTKWRPISGTVRAHAYNPEQPSMLTYGGFTWPAHIVEEALESRQFLNLLKDFDPNNVDPTLHVDPFLKRSILAQEIAQQRIYDYERALIGQDIHRRVKCDRINILNVNVKFKSPINLSYYLISAYVLRYLNQPPRIMAGFNGNVHIAGPKPISVPKFMAAATVVTGIISLMFPQVAVPIRAGAIAASLALTGAFAQNKLYVQYLFQEKTIRKEREFNESIAEIQPDRKRREATEGREIKQPIPPEAARDEVALPAEDLRCLGIDPATRGIDEKMVQRAYHKQIKMFHTDTHKGQEFEQKTRDIIMSHKRIMDILKGRKDPYRQQKRFYSTARIIKQPPRSVQHPLARQLINAVLVEENYSKALMLVEVQEVHPDSHDKNENTLLTEAAKQGNLAAIEFAIDKLGASLDTSCHCPWHRTALHYAVEFGHIKAVRLLLDKGANPNLINSYGQTPLDVAVKKDDQEMVKLLESRSALKHNTIGGLSGSLKIMRGLTIGYSSNDRTRLLTGQTQPPNKALPPKP